MILEWKDIEHLIPHIKREIREELSKEEEQFLDYPKGLQKFLYGEVNQSTYRKVYNLWNKRSFPRMIKEGLRGVKESELWEWLKN